MIVHYLQAAVLGAVQGITEFLPVSSTGHLIIFQTLFGLDQKTYGLSFDMFTNLGTTLALIWFFRKELVDLLKTIRLPSAKKPLTRDEQAPWWILGITVVVGALGVVLEKHIDSTFRTLPIIATSLIAVGIIMLWAEKYASRIKQKAELDTTRAWAVGLSQVVAFIPGVSRSGATISTGLFAGLSRENAARFSFLLSVPVTLAAIGKRMLTALHEFKDVPPTADIVTFYIIGFLAAGIVGYLAIKFFLAFLRTSSLAVFAYYRFGLAAVLLAYITWS